MPKESRLKDLEYYADLSCELVDNPDNVEQRNMWTAFDNMYKCKVTIPSEIKALVGEAVSVSTLPKSAVDAVTRFLITRNPSIHLKPMLPDPKEHERMEFGEVVLQWHWNRAQERGDHPFREDVVHDLALYGRSALRTNYLPWEFKKNKKLYSADRRSAMRTFGDFQFTRYSPHNIYPEWSDDWLECVVGISVISLFELKNRYDHASVKKVISKELKDTDDKEALRSNYVTLFDYMDDYCSCLFFKFNGANTSAETDGDPYELKRMDHKLGFLPWVIKSVKTPILEGIYQSKIYDQNAIERTIFIAKMLQMVAAEDTIISAPNPDDPNLVSTGESLAGEKTVGPGVSVQRMQPFQLDQNLMSAIGMSDKEMAASASVSALVAIEQYIGGNTPFSSINAAQSTAAAHLGPIQNATERIVSEALSQELRWIYASNEGAMGYRERSKGSGDTDYTKLGARFLLRKFSGPNSPAPPMDVIEFKPDELQVDVVLNPMTIQDKQAMLNQAVIAQQAGLPFEEAVEHITDDPQASIMKRGKEMLVNSLLKANTIEVEAQARADGMIQAAQFASQQIMAQIQQAQQQPQGQGGVPPSRQTMVNNMNSGPMTQAMRGKDVRQGAPPEAQMAPGETATQTQGKAPSGQELA